MSTSIKKYSTENSIPTADAKKNVTVELCAADIKGGSTKDPSQCAFARACKRAMKVDGAYFFRSTAWLEKDGKLTRYMIPPSMQKEIVAFDRKGTMEPGTYELTRPCKSQTMRAFRARSRKRPGRHQPANGKIKRKVVHRVKNIRGLSWPTP